MGGRGRNGIVTLGVTLLERLWVGSPALAASVSEARACVVDASTCVAAVSPGVR